MTEKQIAKQLEKEKKALIKAQKEAQKEVEFDLYGKTLAMYKGAIRSAVRKVWLISKGRKDAFLRTRIPNKDGGRKKYKECCEHCNKSYYIGEKETVLKSDGKPSKKQRTCLVAHHNKPCPDVFDPMFLTRMFGETEDNPADAYSILCNKCHAAEHKRLEENNE